MPYDARITGPVRLLVPLWEFNHNVSKPDESEADRYSPGISTQGSCRAPGQRENPDGEEHHEERVRREIIFVGQDRPIDRTIPGPRRTKKRSAARQGCPLQWEGPRELRSPTAPVCRPGSERAKNTTVAKIIETSINVVFMETQNAAPKRNPTRKLRSNCAPHWYDDIRPHP
jgi:hypothetical protein